LRISKALIELQEKAHEILGIALPRIDDNSEDDSPSSSNSAPSEIPMTQACAAWG
jgi:hypothetical protein